VSDSFEPSQSPTVSELEWSLSPIYPSFSLISMAKW
jgi:hypothetical protein